MLTFERVESGMDLNRPEEPRCLYGRKKHNWLGDGHGVSCRNCGLPLRATLLATQQQHTQEKLRSVPARAPKINPAKNAQAWKKIRALGYECCFWCRQPFLPERPPTEDHMRPVSKGGKRAHGIVFACQTCNSARGDIGFEEYALAVKREHAKAAEERREYRRPRYRKVGKRWMLTAMTNAEIREARSCAAVDPLKDPKD